MLLQYSLPLSLIPFLQVSNEVSHFVHGVLIESLIAAFRGDSDVRIIVGVIALDFISLLLKLLKLLCQFVLLFGEAGSTLDRHYYLFFQKLSIVSLVVVGLFQPRVFVHLTLAL